MPALPTSRAKQEETSITGDLAVSTQRLDGLFFSANARALDATLSGIAGQKTPSVITLPLLSNAAKAYELSTGIPANDRSRWVVYQSSLDCDGCTPPRTGPPPAIVVVTWVPLTSAAGTPAATK